MNIYNINDKEFQSTEEYQEFIKNNPGKGFLKIRAYAASGAIPISGLKVVVRKRIVNDDVIFFEGFTDESGVIERIVLPSPKLVSDNLNQPRATNYEIVTTYLPDNTQGIYRVNIYENVWVIQNVSIVPSINREVGDF